MSNRMPRTPMPALWRCTARVSRYLEPDADPIQINLQEAVPIAYYYSQRMIADRKANPHGEHAEGVWELE